MFRTTFDAVTKVMLAYELCEKTAEQEKKECVGEYGKPAAATVRLNQWWSGAGRRLIIADAWFGVSVQPMHSSIMGFTLFAM